MDAEWGYSGPHLNAARSITAATASRLAAEEPKTGLAGAITCVIIRTVVRIIILTRKPLRREEAMNIAIRAWDGLNWRQHGSLYTDPAIFAAELGEHLVPHLGLCRA